MIVGGAETADGGDIVGAGLDVGAEDIIGIEDLFDFFEKFHFLLGWFESERFDTTFGATTSDGASVFLNEAGVGLDKTESKLTAGNLFKFEIGADGVVARSKGTKEGEFGVENGL